MKTKTFNLKISEATNLVYGYKVQNKKWNFTFGTDTVLVKCKGQDCAHKIAKIIGGAVKRSGKMDGLARKNILYVLEANADPKEL